jgi:hypothetical protein
MERTAATVNETRCGDRHLACIRSHRSNRAIAVTNDKPATALIDKPTMASDVDLEFDLQRLGHNQTRAVEKLMGAADSIGRYHSRGSMRSIAIRSCTTPSRATGSTRPTACGRPT